MSDTDENVTVPEKSSDNAVLLLAAAEELELPAHVVRTTDEGFVVPKEVHEKAFGKSATKKALAEQDDESEDDSDSDDKPAKKAVAKKATGKGKE